MTLTPLTPDPDRAERVRQLCRTQLERSRRRGPSTATTAGFVWRVLAPAAVGAFCILYAATFVAEAVRLQDLFQ